MSVNSLFESVSMEEKERGGEEGMGEWARKRMDKKIF